MSEESFSGGIKFQVDKQQQSVKVVPNHFITFNQLDFLAWIFLDESLEISYNNLKRFSKSYLKIKISVFLFAL